MPSERRVRARASQSRASSSDNRRLLTIAIGLLLLCLALPLTCYWALHWADGRRFERSPMLEYATRSIRALLPRTESALAAIDRLFDGIGGETDDTVGAKLHRAILNDDAHTVEFVLGRVGNMPFHPEPAIRSALLYNRLGILRVLIEHGGARLNDIRLGKYGGSLLDHAVRLGYVAAADLLLEAGVESRLGEVPDADTTPTPLHMAAFYGNRPMVEMLLAKGRWDVNEQANVTEWTPLHCLALGDPSEREYLERRVRDVMARGQPKNPPPVMISGSYDAKGTIKALLEAGADVTLGDRGTYDAVLLAAFKGNFDIAETLLSLGIEPSIESRLHNKASGAVEKRYADLSEIIAQTPGHPTGVKGMLMQLERLAELVRSDRDWHRVVKLLADEERSKRYGIGAGDGEL